MKKESADTVRKNSEITARGKPFEKGQTGNPEGRPKKGYSITEAFKKMFKSDAEKRKKLINAIWASALSGDTTAQKMIWSYMDGMPKQNIKMENESTKEIKDTIKKLQESDEIIRNLCQPTASVGETETQ